jgi:hypothetical protein
MARWVRFLEDYDHKWPSRAMTAFKAGMVKFVRQEVAEAALALHKAEATERPEKTQDVDGQDGYAEGDDEAAPADGPGAHAVAQSDDAADVGPDVISAADAAASERPGAGGGE